MFNPSDLATMVFKNSTVIHPERLASWIDSFSPDSKKERKLCSSDAYGAYSTSPSRSLLFEKFSQVDLYLYDISFFLLRRTDSDRYFVYWMNYNIWIVSDIIVKVKKFTHFVKKDNIPVIINKKFSMLSNDYFFI